MIRKGDEETYDLSRICSIIKDSTGKPLGTQEQQDANEFFNFFCNTLDKELKGTSQAKLVDKIFGGEIHTKITCTSCKDTKVKHESFLSLDLEVKSNLEESLKSFKEIEYLEGDNAYDCKKCKRKVKAEKLCKFQSLPDYLMVTLKRFKYERKKNEQKKINSRCEFPFEVNIEPYSNKSKVKNYYTYKLKGVVLHEGTVERGHYTSLVREKNEWLKFDDTEVKEISSSEVEREGFGDQAVSFINGMSDISMYTQIVNAYILIYERVVPCDASIVMRSHIIGESQQISLFYNKVFHNFFYKIMETKDLVLEYSQIISPELKFISTFIFNILLNTKASISIDLRGVLKRYIAILNKDAHSCLFLLKEFSNPEIIEKHLLNCSLSFNRLFCYSCIIAAFERINPFKAIHDKSQENLSVSNINDKKKGVIKSVVLNLLKALFKSQNKVFKDISYTLVVLCKDSPELRKELFNTKLLEIGFSWLMEMPAEYIPLISKLISENKAEIKFTHNKPSTSEKRSTIKEIRNYRYLINLLSLLVQDYCLWGSDDNIRKDMFGNYSHKEVIKRGFMYVEGRLAAESMADIFASMCADNEILAEFFIKTLFELIKDSNVTEIYKYTIALEKIVSKGGRHMLCKFDRFTESLSLELKGDLKNNYVTSTYLIDALIRLLINCTEIKKYIQSKLKEIDFVKEWLKSNEYPSETTVTLNNILVLLS